MNIAIDTLQLRLSKNELSDIISDYNLFLMLLINSQYSTNRTFEDFIKIEERRLFIFNCYCEAIGRGSTYEYFLKTAEQTINDFNQKHNQ